MTQQNTVVAKSSSQELALKDAWACWKSCEIKIGSQLRPVQSVLLLMKIKPLTKIHLHNCKMV